MAKENGGIIGVLNTPSTTSASGVWAIEDQYQAKRSGTWPLTPFVGTNSLRFNPSSSDYLNRTPASAGNRKTWTFSAWVKKSANASQTCVFSAGSDPSSNLDIIAIWDTVDVYSYSGAYAYRLTSTALFRDPSAWYHLVVALDTTQATNTNRLKLYINGTQLTDFTTTTYPTQNADSYNFNNTSVHYLGRKINEHYWNGYMSDVYFIDGQQLTPSSFGASNASGVWYPIPYTGTYGTNGFNLKFGNSASLGTDSSPNGNNFTVNNLTSVDQSTDTELNNFATLNPNDPAGTTIGTMTEGNLQGDSTSNAADFIGRSTMSVNKGKWYWEAKCISRTGSFDNYTVGIDNVDSKINTGTQYIGYTSTSYAYYANGGTKINNNSFVAYGSSFTAGDIIGVALDLDNGFIYFSKNGTFQNSGVPTSGATGTGNAFSSLSGTFTPAISDTGSVTTCIIGMNFGSPFYAANNYADAAGYGNFSYAVPSGYYALCTANLNTYG